MKIRVLLVSIFCSSAFAQNMHEKILAPDLQKYSDGVSAFSNENRQKAAAAQNIFRVHIFGIVNHVVLKDRNNEYSTSPKVAVTNFSETNKNIFSGLVSMDIRNIDFFMNSFAETNVDGVKISQVFVCMDSFTQFDDEMLRKVFGKSPNASSGMCGYLQINWTAAQNKIKSQILIFAPADVLQSAVISHYIDSQDAQVLNFYNQVAGQALEIYLSQPENLAKLSQAFRSQNTKP